MKKIVLMPFMVTAMFVALNSCQKEEAMAPGIKKSGRMSETTPGPAALETTQFLRKQIDPPTCWVGGRSCPSFPPPGVLAGKRSRLKWDVSSAVASSTGMVYYLLYKKATGSADYNKVDEFSCTETSDVWYAGNALTNGSTFIFLISPSSMSSLPATVREDASGRPTTTSGAYFSGFGDYWNFTTASATGNCHNRTYGAATSSNE